MKNIKTILLAILSWIAGVFFVIGGLGTLFSQFLPGLALMVAGLAFLPPVGHFLKNKANLRLSPRIKGIIFVVAIIVFGATADKVPQTMPVKTQTPKAQVSAPEQTEATPAKEVEPVETKEAEVVEQKAKTLGVSYAQIMQNLSNFFAMEKTDVLVDGQPKYLGQSDLALFEIIGDKRDITQASIVVFFPNDNANAVLQNTALALQFMQNAMPNWPSREDWINKAVHDVQTAPDGKVETNYNGKLVQVIGVQELGMMTFTVKPQ